VVASTNKYAINKMLLTEKNRVTKIRRNSVGLYFLENNQDCKQEHMMLEVYFNIINGDKRIWNWRNRSLLFSKDSC
jgi:hypothetical protein